MGWFRRNEHDEEQLSAYLDGELDVRHAENVERHLVTCDTCAALLEELRGTRALLSALPAQTPRRSFVLGAEYARAPVRDMAPPRRFGMALAPAVALSVFVALLFVDLADFSSTASDESGEFTAASQRQADDDGSAAGSALAPAVAEVATPDAGTDPLATKSAEEATGPTADAAAGAPAAGGGIGGAVETPEGPPAALSAEAGPSPAEGEAANATAAEDVAAEQPSPEPIAFEAPAEDSGGGVSTLRVLQVVAAASFLASGFYVFVWPRLSRGGSNS